MSEELERILNEIPASEVINKYKDYFSKEHETNIVMGIQISKLKNYISELETELQDYKNLVESQTKQSAETSEEEKDSSI